MLQLVFIILFSNFHFLKHLGISHAKVKASTSIPDSVIHHRVMKPHFSVYPHTKEHLFHLDSFPGPSHWIFQFLTSYIFIISPVSFFSLIILILTTRDFSRLNYYIQQMLKENKFTWYYNCFHSWHFGSRGIK